MTDYHYLVKEESRIAVIFKRFDGLDEAVKHCMIYTRANEGKSVSWWVLSTSRLVPDGHTVDWDN